MAGVVDKHLAVPESKMMTRIGDIKDNAETASVVAAGPSSSGVQNDASEAETVSRVGSDHAVGHELPLEDSHHDEANVNYWYAEVDGGSCLTDSDDEDANEGGDDKQGDDIEPGQDPETNKPLRWTSHGNTIAGRQFEMHEGKAFGRDHRIWEHLREGSRIGVWMCAQYGGWQNTVKEVEIGYYQWFEPTLV